MNDTAPAKKRPTILLVLAIVNGLFGLSALASPLLITANLKMQESMNKILDAPPNPVTELMLHDEGFRRLLFGQSMFGVLLGILLIASAVGLFQMKPWGRTLVHVYAGGAFISTIVGTILTVTTLLGGLGDMSGEEEIIAYSAVIGGALGGCAGLFFPIVLLILVNVADTKRALGLLPPKEEEVTAV